MSLIDDIRKDREAGTHGPWSFTPWHIEEDNPTVRAPDNWIICQAPSDTDARRIARVPLLEQRFLDAVEALAYFSDESRFDKTVTGYAQAALAQLEEGE